MLKLSETAALVIHKHVIHYVSYSTTMIPLVFTKKNKAVQHKATSALPGKFEELGLTCSCGVQSTLDTLNLPSGRVTDGLRHHRVLYSLLPFKGVDR